MTSVAFAVDSDAMAKKHLSGPKKLVKLVSMMNQDNLSELQQQRLHHKLEIPEVLKVPHQLIDGEERGSIINNHPEICALFPHLTGQGPLHLVHLAQTGEPDLKASPPLRVGCVFSGGQASGGSNVVIGVSKYLRKRHPGSTLLGFLDGPKGILESRYKELNKPELSRYYNLGGFHLLGSGRDKIEKQTDLESAAATCRDLDLDGLVIIGGDDSNTNAAVMAEYFMEQRLKTRVIGVPKTIDGDLKHPDVPISFGFDTAVKVYSESIGNIMIDAASARKYWHFIRIMGRAASHVTLECALQTHPQWAFISEEVQQQRMSLKDVAKKVADIVEYRSNNGMNYGVILLPEGLVEFVYDMSQLIQEINQLMAHGCDPGDLNGISMALSVESRDVFESLSEGFKREFLEDRDPHGNVQLSHIESEKLLIRMVEAELNERKNAGTFKGKFAGVPHFLGYEGRCALPSNFDCTYTNALGASAAALIAAGRTGLMATVNDLNLPAAKWRVGGVPLVSMMHMELRSGKYKPVIQKALVELDGAPMQTYASLRDEWARTDRYRSPGPMQFRGHQWAEVGTMTLALEINNGEPVLLTPMNDDGVGDAMDE